MKTLFAFILLTATAHGAVHQMSVSNGKGSAVSIGRIDDSHHLFLTAGHVLSGERSGKVGINGVWYPITVISARAEGPTTGYDLAVFKVRYKGHIKVTEFAKTAPKPGDKLYGYGFARGGPCKTISGIVHDVRNTLVRIKGPEYIVGMSGGGIYDDDEKLVAILSGSEGGRGSRFAQYNRGHLIIGKPFKYTQFCYGGT